MPSPLYSPRQKLHGCWESGNATMFRWETPLCAASRAVQTLCSWAFALRKEKLGDTYLLRFDNDLYVPCPHHSGESILPRLSRPSRGPLSPCAAHHRILTTDQRYPSLIRRLWANGGQLLLPGTLWLQNEMFAVPCVPVLVAAAEVV
jgi:hypothetical protein